MLVSVQTIAPLFVLRTAYYIYSRLPLGSAHHSI